MVLSSPGFIHEVAEACHLWSMHTLTRCTPTHTPSILLSTPSPARPAPVAALVVVDKVAVGHQRQVLAVAVVQVGRRNHLVSDEVRQEGSTCAQQQQQGQQAQQQGRQQAQRGRARQRHSRP